jgi:hypothetical protein
MFEKSVHGFSKHRAIRILVLLALRTLILALTLLKNLRIHIRFFTLDDLLIHSQRMLVFILAKLNQEIFSTFIKRVVIQLELRLMMLVLMVMTTNHKILG